LPEFAEVLLFAKAFVHSTDFTERLLGQLAACTLTTHQDFVRRLLQCVVQAAWHLHPRGQKSLERPLATPISLRYRPVSR